MTGWECYDDPCEDWWVTLSWGVGGFEIPHDHPIPIDALAPYFT